MDKFYPKSNRKKFPDNQSVKRKRISKRLNAKIKGFYLKFSIARNIKLNMKISTNFVARMIFVTLGRFYTMILLTFKKKFTMIFNFKMKIKRKKT